MLIHQIKSRASHFRWSIGSILEPRQISIALGIYVCMAIIFIFAVCIYLHYSYTIYPSTVFNSDDSFAILFSSEILRQHSLFPNWNYSTFVSTPFFPPQAIILPILMAISDHWMGAYRTAIALDQFIMAGLIWYVLGRNGLSRTLRLFLLCCVFAPFSDTFAWQSVLTGQKSWIFAEQLIITCLAAHCIRANHEITPHIKWRQLAMLGAFAIILFFDSSNIGQLLVPISVALLMLWATSGLDSTPATKGREGFSVLTILGVLLVAAAFGQIIFHVFVSTSQYSPLSPKFVDLQIAFRNFKLLIRSIILLFGAAPLAGEKIYSIFAVISIVKFLMLSVAFLFPLILLIYWRRLDNIFLRLLIIVFSVSLGLRVFLYIFSDISLDVTNTSRYFISDALVGISITVMYADRHWPRLLIRTFALVIAIVVIGSSSFIRNGASINTGYSSLVKAVEENNLRQGYGTYWNSNVLTALSNNRVKVRPIILDKGGMAPLRWLSSNEWYDGHNDISSSFLLLKGDERNTDLHPLNLLLGNPTRSFDIGDVHVEVYPFDIAARMGWKLHVDGPLTQNEMRSSIELLSVPERSADGVNWKVDVRITNGGSVPIGTDGHWPIYLGAHLLSPSGSVVENDYLRHFLPMIAPGESVELSLVLSSNTLGNKIVAFDLVQDGVAWFGSDGGQGLRVPFQK